MTIIALVAVLTPRTLKRTPWWFFVGGLLSRGYLVFAFFFFVRSDRLAFYDGTNWWSTVHHPYFRVCVTIIALLCFQKLSDKLWHLYRPRWLPFFAYFSFSALLWWAFAELCTVPRYVSHDHIYLWVYTGAAGLVSAVALATKLYQCYASRSRTK